MRDLGIVDALERVRQHVRLAPRARDYLADQLRALPPGGRLKIERAGEGEQIDMPHACACALCNTDDVEHIFALEREGRCILGSLAVLGVQRGGGQ